MEFGWTREQDDLRRSLREFIATTIDPRWTQIERDLPEPHLKEVCLGFCEELGRRGWLTPHWPEEYGGLDAGPWERVIVGEELWGAGEPRGPQYMNVNWIGPAIIYAGTPEQRARHLPAISSGQVLWSQGFSEPDAGTDLAGLRTRAMRDGDVYVVNGQKIWTSYAHEADWCFLLVRTGAESDRHKGITILLVPMDLPGIEVRDVPTPFGEHVIHEIFFSDVVVPAEHRLGAENEGWDIVRHALSEERIGIARYAYHARILDQALIEAKEHGIRLDDPGLQEDVGMAFAMCEAARMLNYVAVQERIDDPDGRRPMASAWRAMGAGVVEVQVRQTLLEVLGGAGLEERSAADFSQFWSLISPIAAGTLELQLDLIARLQLGLPRG